MNDWFEWNGVKCTEYGIHVLKQPSFIMAQERVEFIDIPGRSGSVARTEGSGIYSSISLACTCVIDSPYDVDESSGIMVIEKICGWLRGNGKVTFSNRTNGFYRARIENQISFDQIVQGNPHRSFSVQFRCDPYFYLDEGEIPFTVTGTTTLINPGNVESQPLIKVIGSGDGSISFTGSESLPSMYINSFDGLSYIILDCEAKIAYKGSKDNPLDPLTLLGTRVEGDWLVIPDGASFLTLSGGIRSVEITPRWRCLG